VAKSNRVEIEKMIRAAFKGVRLGHGVSLRQAQAIDERDAAITDEAFRALSQSEITDRWEALSLAELERDNIAHLDSTGFRYYIPAFMLSLLDTYDPSSMRVIGTLAALYPKQADCSYHMRRYSELNEAQRAAIAKFLVALPTLIELDPDDLKRVQRGVRNYWHEFADDGSHGV
jgi:hypothetical protein